MFCHKGQQVKQKLHEAAGWVDKRNKFSQRKVDEECKRMVDEFEADEASEDKSEDDMESKSSADDKEGKERKVHR